MSFRPAPDYRTGVGMSESGPSRSAGAAGNNPNLALGSAAASFSLEATPLPNALRPQQTQQLQGGSSRNSFGLPIKLGIDGRVPQACARCRASKVKCDSQRPSCSRCLAAGVSECVYPESKPRGRKKTSSSGSPGLSTRTTSGVKANLSSTGKTASIVTATMHDPAMVSQIGVSSSSGSADSLPVMSRNPSGLSSGSSPQTTPGHSPAPTYGRMVSRTRSNQRVVSDEEQQDSSQHGNLMSAKATSESAPARYRNLGSAPVFAPTTGGLGSGSDESFFPAVKPGSTTQRDVSHPRQEDASSGAVCDGSNATGNSTRQAASGSPTPSDDSSEHSLYEPRIGMRRPYSVLAASASSATVPSATNAPSPTSDKKAMAPRVLKAKSNMLAAYLSSPKALNRAVSQLNAQNKSSMQSLPRGRTPSLAVQTQPPAFSRYYSASTQQTPLHSPALTRFQYTTSGEEGSSRLGASNSQSISNTLLLSSHQLEATPRLLRTSADVVPRDPPDATLGLSAALQDDMKESTPKVLSQVAGELNRRDDELVAASTDLSTGTDNYELANLDYAPPQPLMPPDFPSMSSIRVLRCYQYLKAVEAEIESILTSSDETSEDRRLLAECSQICMEISRKTSSKIFHLSRTLDAIPLAAFINSLETNYGLPTPFPPTSTSDDPAADVAAASAVAVAVDPPTQEAGDDIQDALEKTKGLQCSFPALAFVYRQDTILPSSFCNVHFASMLGYELDELEVILGDPEKYDNWITTSNRTSPLPLVSALLTRAGYYYRRSSFRRKDGTEQPVIITYNLYYTTSGDIRFMLLYVKPYDLSDPYPKPHPPASDVVGTGPFKGPLSLTALGVYELPE